METNRPFSSRSLFLSDNAILLYLALTKFVIHVATNLAGGYGYFRDELYYIACSDHMAWGYVDQPPLSIAVLWLSRLLFGDSLFALRLLPAAAGAVVVALAGLMAKELGGNRYAQVLAACSVIAAPLTLGTNSVYSMNSFDVLFWTLTLYLLIIILKNDKQKQWLLLGVILGLGLLNKISVLWLGAGLAVGLLLTPNRKLLLTRRVWLAAAIAFLLFLPHIIWQVVYGFPTMEFIKNATANKYAAVSPLRNVHSAGAEYESIDVPILVLRSGLLPGIKVGKTVPNPSHYLSHCVSNSPYQQEQQGGVSGSYVSDALCYRCLRH